jgi:hypothetical protein
MVEDPTEGEEALVGISRIDRQNEVDQPTKNRARHTHLRGKPSNAVLSATGLRSARQHVFQIQNLDHKLNNLHLETNSILLSVTCKPLSE